MTAVLILAASLAAPNTPVLWCRTAPGANVTNFESVKTGSYAAWLYAPAKSGGQADLAGKKLQAQPDKKKDGCAWLPAGNIELNQGTALLKLGPKTAGVVLALQPGYDPNKAEFLIRVNDHIEPLRDGRQTLIRDTDTRFTMPHYASREEWEAYAYKLRRRVLLSSGLLPMPEKTPLNPVISGRVEHQDYTVEKVRFEARPGFLVTGNLYRPKGEGPFPAIVCPHGHWEEGRLANSERGSVPGRCITLARMGAVVFSYDMIGYVDSLQYEHRWGGKREKLWAYHPFAAQLWSSIRAVDFVQSLPEVDPGRIGCTGASGGGTQTFALCAVEPRVKVSAPVNMISSTMQGGCLCENAPILRLDASNMQIGALMAPRPMMMVSATGDWTQETPRVEYPAIRSIYQLYASENLLDTVLIDAQHNYNKQSREAVYRFFGAHLLGRPEKYAQFREPPFNVDAHDALRVFPDGKLPENLPTAHEITDRVIENNRQKWQAILPKDPASLQAFREQYGDVLALVIGAQVPGPNNFECERTGYEPRGGFVAERWILRRRGQHDAVPAVLYRGPNDGPPQDAVVLVYENGKAEAVNLQNAQPNPLVSALLASGKAVLAIDTFLTGEHKPEKRKTGQYPDTFLPTDTGYRIQDVITAAAWLRSRRDMTGKVSLAGFGDAGVWVTFAAAIDPNIDAVAADANGFNPEDDQAWTKKFYIPCIRSVGDIATAAALIAPRPMMVLNSNPEFNQRIKTYNAGGTAPVIAQDTELKNFF